MKYLQQKSTVVPKVTKIYLGQPDEGQLISNGPLANSSQKWMADSFQKWPILRNFLSGR